MKFSDITRVYFVGIGGIGMSALARYFHKNGKRVAGYDRSETQLTKELVREGMDIHYADDLNSVPFPMKDISQKDHTLVVYTPAVSSDHKVFSFFNANGYVIMKRAQVLGLIAAEKKCIAISGTHGKTTTSTLTAHIFWQSDESCNAFLGGISKNNNTNLLLSDSKYLVVEADEYDRSFLHLYPSQAVVTYVDADHLDIYGSIEAIVDSFNQFVANMKDGAQLVIKKGVELKIDRNRLNVYTYSLRDDQADFYARDITIRDGLYHFDIMTPTGIVEKIKLGVPGIMNVENTIAAFSMAYLAGINLDDIKKAIASFLGVRRRFDYQVRSSNIIYIDDYAHHPKEIAACLRSLKELYGDKKITGIFQPHLFSRTKDFAKEFAESLSMLDSLILLDIYPARELPLEGVTSKLIFDSVTIKDKIMCSLQDLLNILETKSEIEVLVTMGAGNIDSMVDPIKKLLTKRLKDF